MSNFKGLPHLRGWESKLESPKGGPLVHCNSLQVSLAMTRAVKFGRISMDGGFSSENVRLLLEQGSTITTKLAACVRVVKTLTPVVKG